MTKKRQVIITDTGTVERAPVAGGGMAIIFTEWPATEKIPPGRPTEKDWPAIYRWLLAKAIREGDWPRGRGAQKIVEGWVHDWFGARNKEVSNSLVQRHVQLIYEELEKPDK